MNKFCFTDCERKQFERISKRAAEKLFYDPAATLKICPVNVHPESVYGEKFLLCDFYYDGYTSFDSAVNAFEYYNCNSSETGKYAAFYKEV